MTRPRKTVAPQETPLASEVLPEGKAVAIAMAKAIEVWDVERLIPYANNARTHTPAQVDQVAASIKEFGFTNPILVDSQSGIIAGHCRLLAARKLKMTVVPVIILDHLTDVQRRAYIQNS